MNKRQTQSGGRHSAFEARRSRASVRLCSAADTSRRLRGTGALLRSDKVRFVVAGGWNTLLFLVIFTGVQETWGHSYLRSLSVAAVIVTGQAYYMARRWVWKSSNRARKEFPRFIAVYCLQYLANLGLLFVLVDVFGSPVLPAQVVINGALLVMSYLAHRAWTFRARGVPPPARLPDLPTS